MLLSDQDMEELRVLAAGQSDGSRSRELIEILLHHSFASKEEEASFYWQNVLGALFSICLVATGSGLFLGLMTLDAFDLKIIMRSSVDEDEKRYAAALYPIVEERHGED